jgi:hypothetical protein
VWLDCILISILVHHTNCIHFKWHKSIKIKNVGGSKKKMPWGEEVGVVESHLYLMYQSGDPLLHLFPTRAKKRNKENEKFKAINKFKNVKKKENYELKSGGDESSDRELEEIDLANNDCNGWRDVWNSLGSIGNDKLQSAGNLFENQRQKCRDPHFQLDGPGYQISRRRRGKRPVLSLTTQLVTGLAVVTGTSLPLLPLLLSFYTSVKTFEQRWRGVS